MENFKKKVDSAYAELNYELIHNYYGNKLMNNLIEELSDTWRDEYTFDEMCELLTYIKVKHVKRYGNFAVTPLISVLTKDTYKLLFSLTQILKEKNKINETQFDKLLPTKDVAYKIVQNKYNLTSNEVDNLTPDEVKKMIMDLSQDETCNQHIDYDSDDDVNQ